MNILSRTKINVSNDANEKVLRPDRAPPCIILIALGIFRELQNLSRSISIVLFKRVERSRGCFSGDAEEMMRAWARRTSAAMLAIQEGDE